MAATWGHGLPRPVAFVLSGGASLGAVQVGMLSALAEAGVRPDLLVGTSVGALHAAVLAEHDDVASATTRLEQVWTGLRTRDVFVGGPLSQAVHAARHGTLHPSSGLERLVRSALDARDFDELRLPLTVVTADVLTGHVRWLRRGELVPALLAATAIPGVFPQVRVGERTLWDAGSVANVPLRAAISAGAGSIVVLDAGDVCHREEPPRGLAESLLVSMRTAMRQRVLLEAPAVARRLPLAYLPRPCVQKRSLLDLDSSIDLVAPARAVVADFLASTRPPTRAGQLVGAPHHHPTDGDESVDPVEPVAG